MNTSKQIFEKAKREQKAKDVIVTLSSSTTNGFAFRVLKKAYDKISKYIGEISKDHKHDECTCQSFMIGNSENYQRDNPLPFTCKHILAAHKLMEGYW